MTSVMCTHVRVFSCRRWLLMLCVEFFFAKNVGGGWENDMKTKKREKKDEGRGGCCVCVSECGGVRHLRWGCAERSREAKDEDSFALITPRGCDLERARASDCASAENNISDKKESIYPIVCVIARQTHLRASPRWARRWPRRRARWRDEPWWQRSENAQRGSSGSRRC